jgi:hypothetical protein
MKTSEREKPINIFWPSFLTILSDVWPAAVIVIIIGMAVPGDFDYSLGTFIAMALLMRDGATDLRTVVAIAREFRRRNLDKDNYED